MLVEQRMKSSGKSIYNYSQVCKIIGDTIDVSKNQKKKKIFESLLKKKTKKEIEEARKLGMSLEDEVEMNYQHLKIKFV